jgi:hypothetical protein
MVDPPPEVVLDGRERMIVRWHRGTVHFTEIDDRHDRAVISVLAACMDARDVAPKLAAIEEEIRINIENARRPWSHRIPRLLWQVSLGGGVGLATWVSVTTVFGMVGSPVGEVAGLVSLAMLISYFSGYPRIFRAARLRKEVREGLLSGDHDGTVRRALASVGVKLPPD